MVYVFYPLQGILGEIDHVFVACASCATVLGIALGAYLTGSHIKYVCSYMYIHVHIQSNVPIHVLMYTKYVCSYLTCFHKYVCSYVYMFITAISLFISCYHYYNL